MNEFDNMRKTRKLINIAAQSSSATTLHVSVNTTHWHRNHHTQQLHHEPQLPKLIHPKGTLSRSVETVALVGGSLLSWIAGADNVGMMVGKC